MTASSPTAPPSDEEWLPTTCPRWCVGEHAVALSEGNSWYDSQRHVGHGPGHALDEIRNPIDKRVTRPAGASYNLQLSQRSMDAAGGFANVPTVNLDVQLMVDDWRLVELALTSGEARTLAAQLVHMADRLDFL